MPWPSANGSLTLLKKVRRSRKCDTASLPGLCSGCCDGGRSSRTAAFDVEQQATPAGVDEPRDGDAAEIEDQEAVQRERGAAGQRDRRAEALGDEEGAE